MDRAKDQPAAPEPRAQDTVPADLAAVAAQIAAEFPLVMDQTSLVLLDVDPGHLHAFWTLAQEDLGRADAAFRSGGGTPEAVIRLRRLLPDGGTEDLATLPLGAVPRGDARFSLANGDAPYQAEIGLRNAQGGWLLLARSNQARLPRPVGTRVPAWNGEETPDAAPLPSLEPPPAPGPEGHWHPGSTNAGLASATAQAPAGIAPAPQSALLQAPEPGTRPARWVLDTVAAGGVLDADPAPRVALPRSPAEGDAWPAAEQIADLAPADGAPPPIQPWEPAIRADWPWTNQGGPDARVEAVSTPGPPRSGGSQSPVSAETARHAGPSPEVAPGTNGAASWAHPPGPISSFAVGQGPASPLVEAEVLVHVSARPGTLLDLYGRPLRVGPSGRSTLRLPVTDPGLLDQLLRASDEPQRSDGG